MDSTIKYRTSCAYHALSAAEAAERTGSSITYGLDPKEAAARLNKYGRNVLKEPKHPSILSRFARQFADTMVIILLVAAAVSFALSWINGEADFSDPAIILVIVVINAAVGVVQESRAEKALDALKKITSPSVRVKRGGAIVGISTEELVRGDVILLAAGDFVPADARLTEAESLKTDESALTGESDAAEKSAVLVCGSGAPVGDRRNMVWANTAVLSGRGAAVVCATGMNTEVGKIASMLIESDAPETPLQQKLEQTGRVLGVGALAICAVIFFIGLMRNQPPFDMFMTSVSLAVAAIPEGLPAIVTIMLALGVRRMAAKKSIVRHLPAVETLGSASVICSDKTGTLTKNMMTVTQITGNAAQVLTLAVLCGNDSGPTERAITVAAGERGITRGRAEQDSPRAAEIPFDSARKTMTTLHRAKSGWRIIVKGAPDVLLPRCAMTEAARHTLLAKNSAMASSALRVIAVAYADSSTRPARLDDVALTFAGFIGMTDPPRPEVRAAVETCKRAGITPVMITGDHVMTALAVARQTGIAADGDLALTGAELDAMNERELIKAVGKARVFARVTPAHKARIVRAFQARGGVVAMTGDGVNDAPALKAADIGCAMGMSGTDVARGAADMVLTDDNFATIVEAVREGRGIYANIRRAVHFLLSSNVGEIITIFTAILLGWDTPLLAIQLLWVNLVTDSLPALALGAERPEETIMQQPPVNRSKGIFAGGLVFDIAVEGFMIGALALIAFGSGCLMFGGLAAGRTMAFMVLSLSQLVHAYNMRKEGPVAGRGMFKNKYLNEAFIICAALQISVSIIPALSRLFKVISLTAPAWCIVAGLALVPLAVLELKKRIVGSRA